MIWRQTNSPSPVPLPIGLVVEKASNAVPATASASPVPVSSMTTSTIRSRWARSIAIRACPASPAARAVSIESAAFCRALTMICSIPTRGSSRMGSDAGAVIRSAMSRSDSTGRMNRAAFWMASMMLIGSLPPRSSRA